MKNKKICGKSGGWSPGIGTVPRGNQLQVHAITLRKHQFRQIEMCVAGTVPAMVFALVPRLQPGDIFFCGSSHILKKRLEPQELNVPRLEPGNEGKQENCPVPSRQYCHYIQTPQRYGQGKYKCA